MRKLLVLLLIVASLATAGAAARMAKSAAAASQTVTISATGYKPTTISIFVGDSVIFKNSDTVAHTVDFKQTTGLHCSAALPLAIAAGQSASCAFSSAGKFTFSDPAHKGKNFRGTVTVNTSLTSGPLTVTPATVVYGRKSTLAGTLASKQAGQSVQVLATECGTTTSKLVSTVTTTTGGKFSYAAQPLKKTSYTAKSKSSTSPAATAKVAPRLQAGHLPALPESDEALGQGEARDTEGEHDRRRTDGHLVGEVPLEDQGTAEGAHRPRAEASRRLLRRGT
jgi:plastocyanin